MITEWDEVSKIPTFAVFSVFMCHWVMIWYLTALLLCAYGTLKEFKPSEPYLFQYQHEVLNVSQYDLNVNVYPFSTYSILVSLLPVLLLTDLVLYKPVLLVESLSFIGTWLTLLYWPSVLSQQIGQILYGISVSTEVAYFSYIYVKVGHSKYAAVTAWTRSALLTGKCLAYFLAEILVSTDTASLRTLNHISLCSLSLTFVAAMALPAARWQDVVERRRAHHVDNTSPLITPHSYPQFVKAHIAAMRREAKAAYSQPTVLRWSVWWAMATCGNYQIGNYIQTLWSSAENAESLHNGFVEGIIPLLAICAIFLVQLIPLDWSEWGGIALTAASLVDGGLLLLMALTSNIWIMYVAYGLFRILYQCAMTIAQYIVIDRINADSSGLIFGLNSFLATIVQTGLSLLVTNVLTEIRLQFYLYAVFHAAIPVAFFAVWLIHRLVADEPHIKPKDLPDPVAT